MIPNIPTTPEIPVSPETLRATDAQIEPITLDGNGSLSALMQRIGNARVVLIGTPSYGASELQRWRARITAELIAHQGFNIVGLESDWLEARALLLNAPQEPYFGDWAWRNRELRDFVSALRGHLEHQPDPQPVGVYGLDVFAANAALRGALTLLDQLDPACAEALRLRRSKIEPWCADPAIHAETPITDVLREREDDVVALAVALLKERLALPEHDEEDIIDANFKARLLRNAPAYYRARYYGTRDAWNLREQHMLDTIQALLHAYGTQSKIVIWAHNTHVGNAAATDMATRGQFSLGQLCRQSFGGRAFIIGSGTYNGSVMAAPAWGMPAVETALAPPLAGSFEQRCHEICVATGVEAFTWPLRNQARTESAAALRETYLQRALSTVYSANDFESEAHYLKTRPYAQYDEYVWIDETHAVARI